MKAYISIGYQSRKAMSDVISEIVNICSEFGIESLVFVDKYAFEKDEERQMMLKAMQEIDECDVLIAETSEKGIGVGIEVGYAKAKGKTVIYLRNKTAEHSTTVSGISDFQIIYDGIPEMKAILAEILQQMG